MIPTQPQRKVFLVGGGIASLAAAVTLIRDGHLPGPDIRILEAARLGGSLDAAGSAEAGYSMRGSRMYGAAYVLMHQLLSGIPSLADPEVSVAEDTLAFWQEAPWDAKARLVEKGRIADAAAFGLSDRERVELVGFLFRQESALGAMRIDECFGAPFFDTHFWILWRSMFGFEVWHSAVELRRYLLRFQRLFSDLPTLRIMQSTRYNGHGGIVRPVVRWLEGQGVQIDVGVSVTDLEFAPASAGRKAVRRIQATRGADRAEESTTCVIRPHPDLVPGKRVPCRVFQSKQGKRK